jgi:hypothetical protein
VTVSFGPEKTPMGVVGAIGLSPSVVSTSADTPVTVTVEFDVATTTSSIVVDTPLPLKTLKVVVELKCELKADVAPLAPVSRARSEAPFIAVVSLILSYQSAMTVTRRGFPG